MFVAPKSLPLLRTESDDIKSYNMTIFLKEKRKKAVEF